MAGDANVPRLHLSLRRPLGSLSSPSSSSSEDSVELADDGSDAGDPRTTIVCLGRDHSVLFYDYHLVTVQHVSIEHTTKKLSAYTAFQSCNNPDTLHLLSRPFFSLSVGCAIVL